MKIRFASRSTVVNRAHEYYLVVEVETGYAQLMSYSQMPHNLQQVTKRPAQMAFRIEDVCMSYCPPKARCTQPDQLRDVLLTVLDEFSPDEKWVFHSRSPQ